MQKNSPDWIARNIAILIGIFSILISSICLYFGQINVFWVLAIGIVNSLLTFFLLKAALKKFIYEKIKIIYKNMHTLKGKKVPEKKIDLKRDILGEVNTDVMLYAQKQKDEIDQLHKLTSYRKEFLGNVSHELKTPIFSIQGYIHTLIDGGIDDPKINKNYLYKAARNVERLSHIVSDLETISSFEAGELGIKEEPFDIVKLAEEVFESLEIKAEAKSVNLKFKESYAPINVLADRERIRQVLVNLADNSIKYGKEEGKTSLGFYDMEDHILIEVKDNGPGIAAEHLPRLFERFYRVDTSRSREEGGTGLGLSIVKHIIEAHGQTINVRSSTGKGTTFGFTLKKA